MAKKRKSSKKSKKDKKSEGDGLPDNFWAQVWVIVLGLLAIILLFGSFGTGGSVATGLYEWARTSIGYLAYIAPFILLFAAVQKQRGENRRIPRGTFWGMVFTVLALAGFLHIFIDPETARQVADEGNGGGYAGLLISGALLTFFNQTLGAIVLLILFFVMLYYTFKWSPASLLRAVRIEPKKITVTGDNDKDEPKDEEPGFKLNEGVPVQKKLTTLKNTAKKLTDDEIHDALTTSSDPAWEFPPLDLLDSKQDKANAGDVEGNAEIIRETLGDFNIEVDMQGANIGPRVTQYTLKPPSGVRLTKITALENNLALNLAATSIRMEAPIPGQRAVGIEVPNVKAATVRVRSILESNIWKGVKSPLAFPIGKDIAGQPVVAALDSMPHLLIAGATGSGKSVMINTFLAGLLYRNSPADLKLILVDPKQVELTPYNDIPHLLTPVITEPEKCISALKWAVAEMERRYRALADEGKRNIAEYNKVKKEEGMPYIVIVIDELADLMMLAARDVEALIVRIAQKARAVGIHLVVATQRPSVDVITGLIKANIPARIAFTVAQQVDSRTILDQVGAEKLLGQGDMLFSIPELPKPKRIQGAFISDAESKKLNDHLRMNRAPDYDDEVVAQPVNIGGGSSVGSSADTEDSLYEDAAQTVIEAGKASASLLQRRLRVGYARAARLIEALEDQGIVGPADGSRPRDVLVTSMDDITSGDDGSV